MIHFVMDAVDALDLSADKVSRELLAVAITLFTSHDPESRCAERRVLLEDDEISEALNEHPAKPKPSN